MVTTPIFAVPAQPYYQYDGTNATDLVDMLNAAQEGGAWAVFVLDSADAESMTWELYRYGTLYRTYVINTGDYLDASGVVLPAAALAESYIVKQSSD